MSLANPLRPSFYGTPCYSIVVSITYGYFCHTYWVALTFQYSIFDAVVFVVRHRAAMCTSVRSQCVIQLNLP